MSPNQQTLPTQPIRIPTKMSGRKKTDTSTTSPTKEAPSDTAANDIATYSNQYPTTESAPQLETSRTKPHKNNKGNTTKAYKQQSEEQTKTYYFYNILFHMHPPLELEIDKLLCRITNTIASVYENKKE